MLLSKTEWSYSLCCIEEAAGSRNIRAQVEFSQSSTYCMRTDINTSSSIKPVAGHSR